MYMQWVIFEGLVFSNILNNITPEKINIKLCKQPALLILQQYENKIFKIQLTIGSTKSFTLNIT